jgi:hypothetical protein
MTAGNGLVLALDPSSSATGWAIFQNGTLLECGVFTVPGHWDSWRRTTYLARNLAVWVRQTQTKLGPFQAVLVEVASNYRHAKRAVKSSRFSLGGLMTLGHSQGFQIGILETLEVPWEPVLESDWTGGIPKTLRAIRMSSVYPIYQDFFHQNKDPGLDAADAVGLGDWWYQKMKWEQKCQRMGHKRHQAKSRARTKTKRS